jgi:ubiquitin-activating enzyme E1
MCHHKRSLNFLNRISELVETISKKPVAAHVKALVLEICVNDKNDEDVEVPYVKIHIR